MDITKRYPGVEGGGDERMPQGVRPDRLGHSGAAGYPAHDPPGTVPVQPAAISRQEDRSFGALADGQVDRPRGARCERDGDNLAALAGDEGLRFDSVRGLHKPAGQAWVSDRVRHLQDHLTVNCPSFWT